MPNGGPDYTIEEWDRVDDYFKKNQEVLIAFSETYGLFIDKYYHNDSSWDFRFRHPKGGHATIELKYNPKTNQILISSNWYIDVYDEFTRYLQWGDTEIVTNETNLFETLKKRLIDMSKWDKNKMKTYGGYKDSWGKYSKTEFEKMVNPKIKELKNLKELR
jgi:hypothetical protein